MMFSSSFEKSEAFVRVIPFLLSLKQYGIHAKSSCSFQFDSDD
jgi:hypothetical protein